MSSTDKAYTCKRIKTSDVQSSVDGPNECAATSKALLLPEILNIIFCHLDAQSKGRAAQVSKSWHDLIERPWPWSNVKVGLLYDETKPIQYIIKPEKILIKVEIDQMTVIQPSSRSYPFIRKLTTVATTTLTDKTTQLIVQRFNNLTSLKLGFFPQAAVSDASLTLIVAGLKSLRHLNLDCCTGITDMGVASLCGWNGVTSGGNVPTLYSLTILGNLNLTDEAIKYLSCGQVTLRSLDLSICPGITNRSLELLTHLKGLRILNLRRCPNICEDGMVHLAKMPSLINIDLSLNQVTTAELKVVAYAVPRLTKLTLFKCQLEDKCCLQLAHFTHLSFLNLSGTNIDDSVLQCLADGAGASTIDTIHLSSCRNLTPQAGKHLARMKNLRVVNLSHSPIGDAGLGHMADVGNSRIEILTLDGNKDITDVGLNHVNCLPRLRQFQRNNIRLVRVATLIS